MDPIYIPIVAGLVAAGAGTAGAFVANWLIHRANRRAEDRKLFLAKLEEAYPLTFQVVEWLESQVAAIPTLTRPTATECPIVRVTTLLKFYEPAVSEQLAAFAQATATLRGMIDEFWRNLPTDTTPRRPEYYPDYLREFLEEVRRAQGALATAIEQAVRVRLKEPRLPVP